MCGMITSPHILTIGQSQYDLRKAINWAYGKNHLGAAIVTVWFQGQAQDSVALQLPDATWDVAKAASLAAE